MGDLTVPRILQGAYFVGIEEHEHHTVLVFRPAKLLIDDGKQVGSFEGLIRVSIICDGRPTYLYSVFDWQTKTLRHYEGEHGDPDDDDWEVIGVS